MGREDARYRRGRSGRPYERAKARVFATETHCARCGRWVDKALPHRDPVTGRVNIWSKTFGHTTELDAGGHPLHGHLEHLHCNVVAGAEYGNAKRARRAASNELELRTSGDLDDDAPPLRPRSPQR
jgi:hypothetical protein